MTKSIIGVDIAKDKFDALLLLNEQQHRRTFNNTLAGWKQLVRWLQRLKVAAVHACMEATGRLWEGLALHLQETGHEVSVVNPVRIKRYAQSRLARNKNDEVDALLVAQFCREQKPPLWKAPSAERRQLQDLSRLLFSRKQQLQQEKNRLKSGVKTAFVVRAIKALIKQLKAHIRDLETEIKSVLGRTTELQQKTDLLKSIPGISDCTASVILAELPDVEHFDRASQVAAYAGLSPAQRQSGSSLRGKTRLCKTGNARLRQALYLPAVVASRCNPLLKARAQRLRAAGKTKMCVVGAIMHHLLRLAYGVLKHNRPFDPNFAVRPASAANK
jgi:transposase